jgi:hypothetical protein
MFAFALELAAAEPSAIFRHLQKRFDVRLDAKFLRAPLNSVSKTVVCPSGKNWRHRGALALLHIEAKAWLYRTTLGNALQNISDSSSSPDGNRLSAVELRIIPV